MTGKPLTDAEVICSWMEARPSQGPLDFSPWRSLSPGHWWTASGSSNKWAPSHLTLNELHDVESRLIEAKKARWYDVELREGGAWWLWHATAEQKTCALAAVLRPLVEGAEASA